MLGKLLEADKASAKHQESDPEVPDLYSSKIQKYQERFTKSNFSRKTRGRILRLRICTRKFIHKSKKSVVTVIPRLGHWSIGRDWNGESLLICKRSEEFRFEKRSVERRHICIVDKIRIREFLSIGEHTHTTIFITKGIIGF